VFYEAK